MVRSRRAELSVSFRVGRSVGILAPTGTGIGSTAPPPPSGDARSIPSSSPKMLNLICFSTFSENVQMAQRMSLFGRRNVEVEWECIERIVFILDGPEPGVDFGGISRSQVVFATFSGEVQIHFARPVGCHCVSRCPGPGDMLRKICRVRRTRGAIDQEWGAAVGKCCTTCPNSGYCPAEVMDVQL